MSIYTSQSHWRRVVTHLRQLALPPMLFSFACLRLVTTVNAQSDAVLGPPPGSYRLLTSDSAAKIPFEIYRGDILMRGTINGKEVRMMLDNGRIWDELLLWGGPRVDSLQLNYGGQIQVGGSGEGAEIPSRTASDIVIGFPGIEFLGQSAVVTSPDAGLDKMWHGTDGQISGAFFKHFVVDINFDTRVLTLINPKGYCPSCHKTYGVALPLKAHSDGSWSIPGKLTVEDGTTLDLDFTLDLGFGDALQIDPREQHKIPVPRRTIETSLGFGVQGETRGHLGRVRRVSFGNYILEDVLAGFVSPDDSGAVKAEAMIGLELLSRFNIVFDYPQRKMYLTPNRSATKAFEYDMTGMMLKRTRQNQRVITRVFPDSPAADAGIVVGDTLKEINSIPAGEYDFYDLQKLFAAKGTKIDLTIRRGSQEMSAVLILRRVI